MKIMFLDESGDHNLAVIDPHYPIFVLAGAFFDFEYYKNAKEKVKFAKRTLFVIKR